MKYYYIKLVVQRNTMKQSSDKDGFSSESEQKEYEAINEYIEQIEKSSGIHNLTKDTRVKYIEYLKEIVKVLETFGLCFKNKIYLVFYQDVYKKYTELVDMQKQQELQG